MSTDFLFNKSKEPSPEHLTLLLGPAAKLHQKLDQFLEEEMGQINFEWKFYTKKSGWTRKALVKKRNLLFFSPKQNMFSVTFVFGDKAVEAVGKSDLPDHIKTELSQARKYMEGRGIRIDVTTDEELDIVKKLLLIKVES